MNLPKPLSFGLLLVLGAGCSPSVPKSTATGTQSGSSDTRAAQAVAMWQASLDTLQLQLSVLDTLVQSLDSPDRVQRARAAFVAARLSFKRAEMGLEYYAPTTTRAINGPALPEVEEEEGPDVVLQPTGFQVVEEALYDAQPEGADELPQDVRTLRNLSRRTQTMMAAQVATDDRIFDAARLEIARIVTLGISGFDSPVAGLSLVEAEAALDGIMRALSPYRVDSEAWRRFDESATGARRALNAASDRDTFDHFGFIVAHANPLARALQSVRESLKIGTLSGRRAFRATATTLFDRDAFDVLAFAPLDEQVVPEERVALGEQLFGDPRLSGDGSRACSACHDPQRAFTDGMAKSRGRSGQPLPRNTPSVMNSGLQVGSFADLRTTFLEDQVTEVIESADEMHARFPDVATVLRRDSSVVSQFRASFREDSRSDSLITGARIRRALAAYLRSLNTLNSPVDGALRGDTIALTPEARRGFNVFVGKGKCATCHFLPLTNGTVPPTYQKTDVEVLGVPMRPDTLKARVDPDEGRYRITRAAPHRYAFRTPTLRNVALTAPYMHNGAYRTLESVIDFYNRGGGAGIGIALEYQTLPSDTLGLTAVEQKALVSFLRALTDTTSVSTRASTSRLQRSLASTRP